MQKPSPSLSLVSKDFSPLTSLKSLRVLYISQDQNQGSYLLDLLIRSKALVTSLSSFPSFSLNQEEIFDVILIEDQLIFQNYEDFKVFSQSYSKIPQMAFESCSGSLHDTENLLRNGLTEIFNYPLEHQYFFQTLAKFMPKMQFPQGHPLSIFDPETADMLCQEFLKLLQERLDHLKKAVADDNPKEIHGMAHQLKGSAANFGFTDIFELAKSIEEALEQNQKEQIPSLLKNLETLSQSYLGESSKS